MLKTAVLILVPGPPDGTGPGLAALRVTSPAEQVELERGVDRSGQPRRSGLLARAGQRWLAIIGPGVFCEQPSGREPEGVRVQVTAGEPAAACRPGPRAGPGADQPSPQPCPAAAIPAAGETASRYRASSCARCYPGTRSNGRPGWAGLPHAGSMSGRPRPALAKRWGPGRAGGARA
jgi:hypothetical protein